jgi:hypothetical protein
LKIFWTPERDPSRSFFPLLVGFAKEIGERERHGKARVTWPRFEFKFES